MKHTSYLVGALSAMSFATSATFLGALVMVAF